MNKRYYITKAHLQKGGTNIKEVCSDLPELPSVINNKTIKRLIAIGDIHGDLDLAIKYLEIPNLIKRVTHETLDTVKVIYKNDETRYYEWIGKDVIAIQVGDQVDRCRPFHYECYMPEATKNDESSDITIMFFYSDLHNKAIKHNSALYSLLGNHEILNVLGNMSYVSYEGLKEFSVNDDMTKGRVEAFKINSKNKIYKNELTLAQFMGCSRLTSLIVNDYLFVHAGVMEKLLEKFKDSNNKYDNVIPSINNIIKNWLLNKADNDKTKLLSLLNGQETSPFWPRLYGILKPNLDISENDCLTKVKPVLEKLMLKGMIVGHTPQNSNSGINSTCSNTIWRVDIGGSQAFDEVLNDEIVFKDKTVESRRPHVLEIVFNGERDVFNILY